MSVYGSTVRHPAGCSAGHYGEAVEDLPAGTFPDRPWDVGKNPKTAVRVVLSRNSDFEVDDEIETKLLITVAPGGYLRRL